MKEWLLLAIIIFGLSYLLTTYPLYLFYSIIIIYLVGFFKKNEGHLIFSIKVNFLRLKLWVRDCLFTGSITNRLIAWYILLIFLNNILIEPLTLQSKRIPSGYVEIVPEIYKGSWKGEVYDDTVHKLSVENSIMNQTFFDANSSDKTHITKCKSPYISYGFQDVREEFEHNFWYPIVEYILFPLIPDTIFGSQYINWSCPNPKDNITDYILMFEPTMEYYPRYEMMLLTPYDTGYDEYQSIKYLPTLFSKYLKVKK